MRDAQCLRRIRQRKLNEPVAVTSEATGDLEGGVARPDDVGIPSAGGGDTECRGPRPRAHDTIRRKSMRALPSAGRGLRLWTELAVGRNADDLLPGHDIGPSRVERDLRVRRCDGSRGHRGRNRNRRRTGRNARNGYRRSSRDGARERGERFAPRERSDDAVRGESMRCLPCSCRCIGVGPEDAVRCRPDECLPKRDIGTRRILLDRGVRRRYRCRCDGRGRCGRCNSVPGLCWPTVGDRERLAHVDRSRKDATALVRIRGGELADTRRCAASCEALGDLRGVVALNDLVRLRQGTDRWGTAGGRHGWRDRDGNRHRSRCRRDGRNTGELTGSDGSDPGGAVMTVAIC